jgi:hypothetical protein
MLQILGGQLNFNRRLSATLAGLTLVAPRFILTGPLNELKAKLHNLTLPPPLGKGLEEENEIVRSVRENAERLEKSKYYFE